YYGDETGSPGSIITFFYWPGHEARGRVGAGQATAIVFSAPADSLSFWQNRLQARHVTSEIRTRFGEEVLAFADPDGIPIEIVAVANDSRTGWLGNGVDAAHALRGMHTAELSVRLGANTEKLITASMDYRLVKREGNRTRFESAAGGGSGHYIDLIASSDLAPGVGGAGTVHHIAFSVPDDATELTMQNRLHAAGYHVSDVRDRQYFNSIYYREPGGILFEIATATPGFPVDESVESLGTALKLPVQFERARAQIEKLLPPISVTR
ncbi:MAG: ring-cleaving dioxygenase, partial [Rariglobus sp.]